MRDPGRTLPGLEAVAEKGSMTCQASDGPG